MVQKNALPLQTEIRTNAKMIHQNDKPPNT